MLFERGAALSIAIKGLQDANDIYIFQPFVTYGQAWESNAVVCHVWCHVWCVSRNHTPLHWEVLCHWPQPCPLHTGSVFHFVAGSLSKPGLFKQVPAALAGLRISPAAARAR